MITIHFHATCKPVDPDRSSLTTVGRENVLVLAWGKGEPAIAMATDWLIVLLPSRSVLSAWAEACRTRKWEDSVEKRWKAQSGVNKKKEWNAGIQLARECSADQRSHGADVRTPWQWVGGAGTAEPHRLWPVGRCSEGLRHGCTAVSEQHLWPFYGGRKPCGENKKWTYEGNSKRIMCCDVPYSLKKPKKVFKIVHFIAFYG